MLLWTFMYKFFCEYISFRIFLEVQLLGLMVTLRFKLWGTASQFSKGAALFYIPPSMYESSNFSTSCQDMLFSFLIFFVIAILVGTKCYLTDFDLHFLND